MNSSITNLTANSSSVVWSLKNCTTYNGINNRAQVRIRGISIASDMGSGTTGMQVLQIWKNVTATTSTYIPINGSTSDNGVTITNGNSIVSVSTGSAITSFTTSSTSFNLFNMSVAKNANTTQDVSDLDIYLNPGDIMTFVVKTITGSTQGTSISANWNEDL